MEQQRRLRESQRQKWNQVFSRRLRQGECVHITVGPDGEPLILKADDNRDLHVAVVSPGLTGPPK